MKVAFYTLGCKVNQYETQAMMENLEKNGYKIVDTNDNADIYVVNSCTVTAESDRKTRQAVRRFKRNHPQSVVVLTGCLPQAFPKIVDELKQADIVLGNKSNDDLIFSLDNYYENKKRQINIIVHENADKFTGSKISGFRTRTRANIKIEDGCNRFCAYCIIPYSRGRVRSKPLEELKEELKDIAQAGFSECVLVGINLSAYGSDIDCSLCDAVELACSFEQIKRVRLGSLEPDHITKKVIERLSKQEKLCPHFHISLQSGCDSTLERMNRHYTSAEYDELCNNLRNTFKDAAISTDVMVGFPAETDEEFEESMAFVEKIGFEKIHVFPYSQREGTKAAKMKEQITKAIKSERSKRMTETAQRIRNEFLKNQVGKTLSVLIEEKANDGFAQGYTANYTPVKTSYSEEIQHQILDVKIKEVKDDFCIGEIVEIADK
ncbi:MAG TPA: tRNA (N(6)-L-threonylcarbamoyladenosine(37)-C(2))-methylthiotransferase MtaB [Clostridia bacterium]|nr:tRNA (N(6)-L-threonylcarbamoyladenosine(37)-C(2))-methylthiotransferase MtaB [Clostridia bacterium]